MYSPFDRTSSLIGRLSSVRTYRHCAIGPSVYVDSLANVELTCRGYSSDGKLVPCAEERHEEGDEVNLVDGVKRLVVGFSDERKDEGIGEQLRRRTINTTELL